MTSVPLRLKLTTATWSSPNEGLFDYHSHHIALQSFLLPGPTRLLRQENRCFISPLTTRPSKDVETLLTIIDIQGRYFVQSESETWQVAGRGSRKHPGISLRVGDVVRFGRTSYKVVSLRAHHSSLIESTLISEPLDLEFEPRKCQCTCRICLSDEETEENPFISPCKCDGSVKFVHIRCLQEWMRSKSEVKTKGCITRCIMNQLKCELCKEIIPDRVSALGRSVELSAYLQPDHPHIVLEEDGLMDESSRILYILSLPPGKVLKIGRGRECDIRIRDFAVSRVNSHLKFQNDQFVLEDKGSKFGSLVQLTHIYPVEQMPVVLQVNKSLVTVTPVTDGWLWGLCCCFSREDRQTQTTEETGGKAVVERRRNRMDTRVAPFEPAESESYSNLPHCVINT